MRNFSARESPLNGYACTAADNPYDYYGFHP